MLTAMGLNLSGMPLCKLTFFKKIERGNGNKLEELTLPYDAEKLETSYSNHLEKASTIGAESGSSRYQSSPPSELKITFLLDDTIIDTPLDIQAQLTGTTTENAIKTLLASAVSVQGETHEPAYVTVTPLGMRLVSGPTGGFSGMLCEIKVENELIDMFGNRLKAKVECCFTESLPEKEIKLKTGRSSPDLTHVLQNKAGDKLLTKAANIYGDVQFAHAVAAVNDLVSIRNLVVGEFTKFPPMER